MMTTKKAKPTVKKKTTKKAPTSPQALVQEMMRLLTSRLGPNDLIMPEDVNALMASLRAPQASDRLSDEIADARAQAQDLAFEAMEASSPARARTLAKRALKLDPDCVDALLIMVELDAHSTRDTLVGLQKAVEAGERSLGAEFIAEQTGRFWLLFETRPYMRVLEALGTTYESVGMHQDAIKIYERMLELNPEDNQGARDPLLGLYLITGDVKSAGKLLRRYKDDAMANFAWGRVLERLLAGDQTGARTALVNAREANQFVEQYLTGKTSIPEELPDSYTPGSEEEATLCMVSVGLAWSQSKDAVFWLHDQCAVDGVTAVPSKKALKIMPVGRKRVQ